MQSLRNTPFAAFAVVLVWLSTTAFAIDKDALIAAIVAHPGEDTPRLAYADWLEEHESVTRAEFIRVQITRNTLPKDDPEWEQLISRERELLELHEDEWLPPGFRKNVLKPARGSIVWERGFVHGLKLEGTRALSSALAREAIDSLPLLKSLYLALDWEAAETFRARMIDRLLNLCCLPRLNHLDLGGLINAPQMRRLARAPLYKLRALTLRGAEFEEGTMAELLAAPWLKQLWALHLIQAGSLFDEGLRDLMSTSDLAELEELMLLGPGARPDTLASGVGMPKLRKLWTTHRHNDPLAPFFHSHRYARLHTFGVELVPMARAEGDRYLRGIAVSTHRLAQFVLFGQDWANRGEENYPTSVLSEAALPPKLLVQFKQNTALHPSCGDVLSRLSSH